jgi:hypothetical protein
MARLIAVAILVVSCGALVAQGGDLVVKKNRMEEVAKSYTPDNAFMGAVLVVDGNTVLLDNGYGWRVWNGKCRFGHSGGAGQRVKGGVGGWTDGAGDGTGCAAAGLYRGEGRASQVFQAKANAELEFVPDAGGAMTGVVLHQEGHDSPGKRR